MRISGYHGSENTELAPYVGLCVTPDLMAAENYAWGNGGEDGVVLTVITDIDGLTVADVAYDYDATEPVLDGVDADVAEYTDCDETGHTHTTWMLLTPAAVAATTITRED